MRGCFDPDVWAFSHPKKSRISVLGAGVVPLVQGRALGYTSRQKSESFLSEVNRCESVLAPLLEDKIVTLSMEVPAQSGRPRVSLLSNKKPVVITPFTLIDGNPYRVLVSVVRGGCTVIEAGASNGVSRLVSIGVPAVLAKALTSEINAVLRRRN